VGITDLQGLRLDLSRAKGTTRADYEDLVEGARRPRRGDIIYSRNASLGQAVYVDADQDFCMGQDLCLISSDRQDQLYMTMQLRSQVVAAQLDTLMVGATFKRINVEQIRNFAVVRPPPSEQARIGLYLHNFATTTISGYALIQEQLTLLAEYRQALITAAVTGQLDEETLTGRKPAVEVLGVEVPS
jgi:type I restriction enzyme S subunit